MPAMLAMPQKPPGLHGRVHDVALWAACQEPCFLTLDAKLTTAAEAPRAHAIPSEICSNFVTSAVASQQRAPTLMTVNVPALVRVAEKGDEAEVRTLLDGGACPNLADDLGITALHGAAKKGHLQVAALLILRGAHVNARARAWRDETPLHYAAKYGHEKVVSLLLAHGGDAAAASSKGGQTPLDYAKERRHACLEALLETAPPNAGL